MAETGTTGLEADTLFVKDRIDRFRPPKRVILFGSRGRGDARENSDIDLCVLYEKLGKRNVEVMQDLYFELFGHMGSPVDLVVYEEADFLAKAQRPHSFEATTMSEGRAIYG
ncbi:MAG: nucleotidyltransferase domain-containing protein [Rectinemataceae bacterium]